MKSILVPTDFSPFAENTLDYATALAENISAELILFHAYYQPVFASDATILLPVYDQLEQECISNLEKLRQKVLKKHPDLHVSCDYRVGLPADTINLYAAGYGIDLIIIGTQGTNYLAERLLGSVATALIKEAVCPVLVVGRQVHFRKITSIVLAADFKNTVQERTLKPLKHLVNRFNAHLYILHVVPERNTTLRLHEQFAKDDLADSFKYYEHTVVASHEEDVITGINDFVELHNAGMVVMLPRKHSLWERIFKEPFVRKMVFHTHVPLLALHTNDN